MYKGKRILATICARGGSEGVKNKNTKTLLGKPLIYYSLDLIKTTTLIDDYIISTDSDKIIELCQNYGCKIDFKRPAALGDGKVLKLEVIKHAHSWAEKHRERTFDVIADIGVTSPLKELQDIEEAIKKLINENLDQIIGVSHASRNPYYNMLEQDKNVVSVVKKPAKYLTDRRDAPKVYEINDTVNVWSRKKLMSERPSWGENCDFYVVPRERGIDIDEDIDFEIAAFFLLRKNGSIKF